MNCSILGISPAQPKPMENMPILNLNDSSRLTEGLSIQNLLRTGMGEIVLNEDDVTFRDVPDDLRHVDSAYEYQDYKDYVNLDLINCDVSDSTLCETTFDSIALTMENVTSDGKVKKRVFAAGTGPPIPEDAIVYVNYDIYLEMSEVPIDSSYLRLGKPDRFHIGQNNQILGFEVAVKSMSSGEKSHFLIHHDYAFGKLGAPPRIPPKATIFAVISVVDVVDCGLFIREEELSSNDRMLYADVSPRAEAEHNLAADYFKCKKVGTAVYHYQAEESMLVQCTVSDPKEEEQRKERLFKVFLNMAVCYNHPQLKDTNRALSVIEKAFGVDPERAIRSGKLFYHRGAARSANGEYKLALGDFEKAQFIEPNNKAVSEKIQLMENEIAASKRVEREISVKAFGALAEKKTAVHQNSESAAKMLAHHCETPAVKGRKPEPVEGNNVVQSEPPSAKPIEARDVKRPPKSPDEELLSDKIQLMENKIAESKRVEQEISVKAFGRQAEKNTTVRQNSESAFKMLSHRCETKLEEENNFVQSEPPFTKLTEVKDVKHTPNEEAVSEKIQLMENEIAESERFEREISVKAFSRQAEHKTAVHQNSESAAKMVTHHCETRAVSGRKPEPVVENNVVQSAPPLAKPIEAKDVTRTPDEEEVSEKIQLMENEIAEYYVTDHVNLDLINCDVSDLTLCETTFESIALTMENVTSDGKVKKRVCAAGTGPPIPEDAMVYVNYDIYLEMSEVPIYSSYLRLGKPDRLHIGQNNQILGFEVAVKSMSSGEKSHFLIHHDYAFGKLGAPPRIPPEATIFAVISVVDVVDCGLLIREKELSSNDRTLYADVSPRAEAEHNLATDYFKRKKVDTAVYHYQAEESMLVQCTSSDPKEEEQRKERLFKVFLNMAVCYNHPQLKDTNRALSVIEKAFAVDPERAIRSAKLFYHRGAARSAKGEYKLALGDFRKAQFIEPNNKAVSEKIQLMENEIAASKRVEREISVKAFGALAEKKTAVHQNSESAAEMLAHHCETPAVKGWKPEPVEGNNVVQSEPPSAKPIEARDVKRTPKSPDEEVLSDKIQLMENKIAESKRVEREISVKAFGRQAEKNTTVRQNSESAFKMLSHHCETKLEEENNFVQSEPPFTKLTEVKDVKHTPDEEAVSEKIQLMENEIAESERFEREISVKAFSRQAEHKTAVHQNSESAAKMVTHHCETRAVSGRKPEPVVENNVVQSEPPLAKPIEAKDVTRTPDEEEVSEKIQLMENEIAEYYVTDHVNLDLINCDVSDLTLCETTFESIALTMENVTSDGKVKKRVCAAGTGPPIPEDAMVYVNYDIYLEMSEVPIYSSYLRLGKPDRLHIGQNNQILGFEVAVKSMSSGEKSHFLIHHDYAFGKLGAPPRIPPEATIFAVISVVDVVDCGLLIREKELSSNDRTLYADVSPRAEAEHNLATDYFKRKKVDTAVYHYQAEESMLVQCTGSDPKEEEQRKERLFKVFLNMAVCYNHPQLKDTNRALSVIEKAFGVDPERAIRSAKLFYHRGAARSAKGEYKLALGDFRKAQFIEPNNKAVSEKIQLMENEIAASKRVEREISVKAFGALAEKKTAVHQNSESAAEMLAHHCETPAVKGWKPEPVEGNNVVQSEPPSAKPIEARDVKRTPKSPDEEVVSEKIQLMENEVAESERVEREILVKAFGRQAEKKTAVHQNSESAAKMLTHHCETRAVSGRKPEPVVENNVVQSEPPLAKPIEAKDVTRTHDEEEDAEVSLFLERFLKSSTALCNLGYGHTPDERHRYKEQCNRLGLVYEEFRRGPVRLEVLIKKKL